MKQAIIKSATIKQDYPTLHQLSGNCYLHAALNAIFYHNEKYHNYSRKMILGMRNKYVERLSNEKQLYKVLEFLLRDGIIKNWTPVDINKPSDFLKLNGKCSVVSTKRILGDRTGRTDSEIIEDCIDDGLGIPGHAMAVKNSVRKWVLGKTTTTLINSWRDLPELEITKSDLIQQAYVIDF